MFSLHPTYYDWQSHPKEAHQQHSSNAKTTFGGAASAPSWKLHQEWNVGHYILGKIPNLKVEIQKEMNNPKSNLSAQSLTFETSNTVIPRTQWQCQYKTDYFIIELGNHMRKIWETFQMILDPSKTDLVTAKSGRREGVVAVFVALVHLWLRPWHASSSVIRLKK